MTGKYELFTGTNGQYYFRLKAGNGEIILSSEGYHAKASAENGIQSVRDNSPYDHNYNRLSAMDGRSYFTLRAVNYQVIGTSQMYLSTQAREDGIASVKANGPSAPVVDLT
ncbi:YegP family protein [Gallaecimonas pentaromativorans]|uniref:DUF1508 domain-containing protein n=1 Tax=Gallaecimonas pentaromativorans TaxID=584787 RepID=A0A3N1PFM1_9GAMM|nr:YegP family protein [Gallaecimonas pentaromativorans]ROQ25807.1 hypothetical protein EDC28_105116 [Gallaecimonas pentaromativorans]